MRERLQPGFGDRVATALTDPVCTFGDLVQSGINLLDGRLGLSRKVQVQLPVDVGGTAFAALFVELDVARLVLQSKGFRLCSELFGLAGVVVPLGREQR